MLTGDLIRLSYLLKLPLCGRIILIGIRMVLLGKLHEKCIQRAKNAQGIIMLNATRDSK